MKTVKKPWGLEKHFVLNKKCTVKILIVNPKEMLSLQKHIKRSETWYFLTSGIAQIGNKKRKLKKGEILKIGKNTSHRIIGKRLKVTEVLEISTGTFEDKDILRLEDKYHRKKLFKL